MAATAWLFDNAPHTAWIEGNSSFLSGTYKCALLTSVPAQSAANWAAISATEHGATGNYSAGGATLASKTCTVTGHVTSTGWANVTWSSATITAKAAVIYNSGTGELYMCVNLNGGADVSSTAGDFTISWTGVSNVAFTVTVATAT
ncbi:MAG: hypothetical protein TUN42_04265 [Dehalogenimonas sp.]